MEVLFRCNTEHLRVKVFEVRMTTLVHSFLATRSHMCTTLHQQGDKKDKLSLRVASTFLSSGNVGKSQNFNSKRPASPHSGPRRILGLSLDDQVVLTS